MSSLQLDLEKLLMEQEEKQKEIIAKAKEISKKKSFPEVDFDKIISEKLSKTKVEFDSTLNGFKDELKTDLLKTNERISSLEDHSSKEIKSMESIFLKTKIDLLKRIKELEKKKEIVKSIKINELPKIEVSQEHEMFEDLLTSVSCGIHVMLVGEAGSGKTTGAERVAKKLQKKFYSLSVGLQTGKHEFFGYMDANGNFVQTEFFKAYTEGGVFLIDEIDAGNAGVLTAINTALANDICSFANGMQKRHKDFICICTANTYGKGANAQYVGRNKLDDATLDRFAIITWNIDEGLEKRLCSDSKWCDKIQSIRKAVTELKLNHLVTTRALLAGEKLKAVKMPEEKILKMLVYKNLDENTINQIKNKMK